MKRLVQLPYAFPPAPDQRPNRGAQEEAAWDDSLGRAVRWTPGASKVLKPGPRGTDSCEGPADEIGKASGEEAHFLLKGVLSPPIISHCPIETRGARLSFFFSDALLPFPISQ